MYHLDDMPAIGYAQGALDADRIEQYLLLLYGHAANYQGRGSFLSNEQQSLYQQEASDWRASLGEIQSNFCTPSQMLVASMTAMQLLWEDRDSRTLWLARAAPRRWYASPGGFGVDRAPSRYGVVSFRISPADGGLRATLQVELAAVDVAVRLRLRDPEGTRQLAAAKAEGDCEVRELLQEKESVVLGGTAAGQLRFADCRVTATFTEVAWV